MILYGAGGHAKVIFEKLERSGATVSCVFDDDPEIETFYEIPVRHAYKSGIFPGDDLIIAIGANQVRLQISERIRHNVGVFVDPTAYVSPSAAVGAGSMIITNAIIQTDTVIGRHCIINSGSIIEHDSHVGDYCHIGPGAVLCGNVTLGDGVFVGANATVLPGVKIGNWAVVAAGAVVTKDVQPGKTVIGNPAKVME